MTILPTNCSSSIHATAEFYAPYADEMLSVARTTCGFQSRDVLRRIVSGEQQRIKEEQMLWRVGGALLGAAFGFSDGFELTDLFVGMAGGSIGGLAHDVMSNHDRRFLEQCQALWLVGAHSPLELAQRLGPARSRILLFDSSWQSPVIFNHHRGSRGDHLVPLGNARNLANGFADERSLEVLNRYFDASELETLEAQLYPIADQVVSVQSLSSLSNSDALAKDLYAQSFMRKSQPVMIQVSGSEVVGYQIPIPATSDF